MTDETTKALKAEKNETKAPDIMPLIPLRGITIFPSMVLHFDIGREKSILALERAMMLNQTVFLTVQKDAETDLPTIDDFYHVGTVARIKQMLKLPGDNIRVLVDGQYRAKMKSLIQDSPYFLCDSEKIIESVPDIKRPDLIALMRTTVNLFQEYLRRHPKMSAEIIIGIDAIEDPGRLADIIASNMELRTDESQKS